MNILDMTSPDLPTPPDLGPTEEELVVITQEIVNENTLYSWEWTDYIYGTILPHIDDLHEADLLYAVEEDSLDHNNYTFNGFR